MDSNSVKQKYFWKDDFFKDVFIVLGGRSSSVGIATGYGLDRPGIESRGDEIFQTCRDRPWGPPSLLYNGYCVIPGSKERPGVTLTPHPLLVPSSKKSRAIPLLTLWAVRPVQSFSACTVQLYLYSPYGPYGLYRASVPVQGCTLPFLILLKLCTYTNNHLKYWFFPRCFFK